MALNQPRALEYMGCCGVDALIATSPVNVTYFSGYYCWLDSLHKEFMAVPGSSGERSFQNIAVLPLDGDLTLVIPAIFAVNAGDLPVSELRLFGNVGLDTFHTPDELAEPTRRMFDLLDHSAAATSIDALLSILEELGLTTGRIGLEVEGLPGATREEMVRRVLHAELKDCSNLIRLMRAVKSAQEIEILARAALEASALASFNRPIADLAQHYAVRLAEMGAAVDHFAYGVGGLGIGIHAPYVPGSNDVLYMDYGCVYQHYVSDAGITLALNGLSPEMEMRYATLGDVIATGKDTIRPGIRASQVQAAMLPELERHGPLVSFPHGHGLGLEIRDYLILVPETGLNIRDGCIDVPSDLPLEKDVIINLEAGMFMPGIASLQIEQSFLVTSSGCRALVSQDRREPYVPGK